MSWLALDRWAVVGAVFGIAAPGGCSDDGIQSHGTAAEGGSGNGNGSATGALTTTTTGFGTHGSATSDGETAGAATTAGEGGTTVATGGGEESSTGGTDTGGTTMQCWSDRDCVVVNDCCSCTARHVDDEAPMCGMQECTATVCDASGLPEIGAVCRFRTCVLEKVECNELEVLCDLPPPQCDDGFLPSVQGSCWGQNCVPAPGRGLQSRAELQLLRRHGGVPRDRWPAWSDVRV